MKWPENWIGYWPLIASLHTSVYTSLHTSVYTRCSNEYGQNHSPKLTLDLVV